MAIAAGAALAAGFVNAVAGGGTLISFPALLFVGLPPVTANVTNTVALCPGYLGGAWAQRRDIAHQAEELPGVAIASGLGGLCGSILLVLSSDKLFQDLIPYLILLACGLLFFQDAIKRRILAHRTEANAGAHRVGLWVTIFVAAIYGGYFGAGLGVMLLAVLGAVLHGELQRLNGLKQALSLIINSIAALYFVTSGLVAWQFAFVMAGASLVGGNLGGRLAGRMRPEVLRIVVVAAGLAVAFQYF